MMRIGAVAKKLGISAGYIRELERRNVVTISRDLSNQRRFSEDDLLALETILFGPTTSSPREPEQ